MSFRVPELARRRLRLFRAGLIDPRLKGRSRSYFVQPLLAGIVLAIILGVENGVAGGAIIASIAASTFIVFVVPHSVAASTRRMVGGHLIGVLMGVSVAAVIAAMQGPVLLQPGWELALAGAVGVGLAILFMVVTNTEHPPAAGTTLGLIAVGATWQSVVFVVSAMMLLTAVRLILLRRLVNLL